MPLLKKLLLLSTVEMFAVVTCIAGSIKPVVSAIDNPARRVLVFAKTAGYRHASIANGLAAIQKLGQENNFFVDTTTNAAYFTDNSLKQYAAVIFLNTTGDVLNDQQQSAFERYIQTGGGFAGIHSAADTEYDWPWYNRLLGAYFRNHPQLQTAVVVVDDKNHPSTATLPNRWQRYDEWYNFRNFMPGIRVLARVDETTYSGGEHGANHPISWYQTVECGRAWYTALGHTAESYSEPLFLQHLLGGIQYAMGNGQGCATLPVELTHFTATLKEGPHVWLHWHTAFEQNSDFFVAEHSADGHAFTPVGTINAHGVASPYTFKCGAPLAGRNYYRIKQVDRNGTIAYSRTVQLRHAEADGVSLFPNPSKGTVEVTTGGLPGQWELVQVFGFNGQIVYYRWHLGPRFVVQLTTLPPGTYFINVASKVRRLVLVN